MTNTVASSIAREALPLDSAERENLLAQRCGGDVELRAAVERLLAQALLVTNASAQSGGRDGSAAQAERTTDGVRSGDSGDFTALHPARIGSYTILGRLGEGGMGQVYLAEQENPKRTVALKVMHAGSFSAAMLRRFEHESQMLARLQHPGIAQIYEAATAHSGSGGKRIQPFFAMEYVKGKTLLEYATEHNLNVRERLELFVKICDAVHHAHQKGVIHRDLKPANIVVDNTGQPKVLDFGIARSTDADLQTATLVTQAGQLVGTVPYMSPEQVAGDPHGIDTRSDVYSLGVIVYELLTGRLPIAVLNRSVAEAARMIQHNEPVTLGSIDRTLRGDIQTIVTKALEKDRARRYQSASDIAADIQRFLNDEPISARPPTLGYQLGKFARRNRAVVVGATSALVLLVGGAAGTAYQAVQATHERNIAQEAKREAELEAQNARGANAFLTGMLGAVNPDEGNPKDVTVLAIIDRAAQDLRDNREHNISTDRAGLSESQGPNDYVRMNLHNTLSNTYRTLGQHAPAIEQAREAVAAAERLVAAKPDRYSVDLLTAKRTLAIALSETADFAGAMALTQESVEGLLALEGPTGTEYGIALGELGRMQHLTGQFPQAQATIEAALKVLTPALGERHKDVLTNLDHLGITLVAQNKYAEALPILRRVLALREEIFGKESAVAAYTINNLANALQKNGDNDEAIEMLQRVVKIRRVHLPPDHPSLLVSMANLAVALTTGGRLEEAEPLLRESLAQQERKLGEKHPKTLIAMGNLAYVLEDRGNLDDAEALFRRVVELRRQSGLTDPESWPQLNNLAMLLVKRNKIDEAAKVYEELLTASDTENARASLSRAIFRNNFGECLTVQGNYARARTELTESHALLLSKLGEEHVRVKRSLDRMNQLERNITSSTARKRE
jgi:tetratricopeptide (TPR) repeat protein